MCVRARPATLLLIPPEGGILSPHRGSADEVKISLMFAPKMSIKMRNRSDFFPHCHLFSCVLRASYHWWTFFLPMFWLWLSRARKWMAARAKHSRAIIKSLCAEIKLEQKISRTTTEDLWEIACGWGSWLTYLLGAGWSLTQSEQPAWLARLNVGWFVCFKH